MWRDDEATPTGRCDPARQDQFAGTLVVFFRRFDQGDFALVDLRAGGAKTATLARG